MPVVQYGYTRDERAYFLLETTYGQTPNSSGVSTLTGANCCSIISVQLDPMVDLYDAEYKTGSRSIIPGQPGRKVGKFTLRLPLKGSGTPGVPADYFPVLTSAFGTQVINSGTSVVYSLMDNPAQTFSLYRFRQPSGLCQQLGVSCIPTRATWTLGQNMANWTVEGECFWVLDSEQFATADTNARAGLTTYPTEPVSPVTNGVQAQGFVGSLIADSFPLINIQQMTITAELGWAQNRTSFGSYYPTGLLGGIRRITATMEAFDDNSAALVDLRAKGLSKTALSIAATIGATPGNIHAFAVNNCQLSYPETTDTGDRFGQRWQSIVAHESTPGAKDEFTMTAS